MFSLDCMVMIFIWQFALNSKVLSRNFFAHLSITQRSINVDSNDGISVAGYSIGEVGVSVGGCTLYHLEKPK